LAELALGTLTSDPFTGKPLAYRVTGPVTYDLYGEGAVPRDGRERTPVRLLVGRASP
jgi:hypothetical protein